MKSLKGLSKGKKIAIGVGVAFLLGIVIYLMTKKSTTAATPVGSPAKSPNAGGSASAGSNATPVAPSDMPALSVVHDTTATDDYTITLGGVVFFYSKGDAPVTNTVDATWSVYVATSQDNNEYVLVSVLKNGNIVYSQSYL